jgi:hypothetical protein
MANDNSSETAATETKSTDLHRTFDELWRLFYAISGCQYAIDSIAACSDSSQETIDKIDGIHDAIKRLASEGERLAGTARDQHSICQ